ncbi:phage portal protein family protein [Arthrobacter sp. TmT3-37]
MAVPVASRGYSTNVSPWWAAPDEEETPELVWPKNIMVFDSMRRQEAQVTSVLRAITLPVRRTVWRIDPNGAREEVVQHVADDLGLDIVGQPKRQALRSQNRFSWSEHLRHALLMLPFGHSFFEQVYVIRDGKAHLKKLEWRPPRTISKIDVAADGGLVAIEQHASKPGTKDARIEIGRLVAYVNEREGGNWLGQSVIRPAYKYWLLKDRALRVQAQTLDRNGMGVPIYEAGEVPSGLNGEEAKKYQEEELSKGLDLAQGLRSGDNSGGAIPHGAKLPMKGVDGTLPDAEKPIRYYDEQIARAVLAHFLNLGTETGSWALGSTFADFFTLSLQTIAMQIADVVNQHVIEDLVDANWGPDELAPKLVFDEIGSRHPATADAIERLVRVGALRLDDPLEAHLRNQYSLPDRDPDTERALPSTAGQSGTDQDPPPSPTRPQPGEQRQTAERWPGT